MEIRKEIRGVLTSGSRLHLEVNIYAYKYTHIQHTYLGGLAIDFSGVHF